MIYEPHIIVKKAVQQKWAQKRSRGIIEKILMHGRIKSVGIIIVQTESFDEKLKQCTGKVLNRWRYDDSGLHCLLEDVDVSNEKVDSCYYCIDKEKKQMMIEWLTIFSVESTRKKLNYNYCGAIYELFEEEGEEICKVIRTWMQ